MALELGSIPMAKVIEVELDTGFMLYEIFAVDENDRENPWAKLVYAYLTALTAGKEVTWQQMKTMGQTQVDELAALEVGDADPKEELEPNN